MKLIDADKLKVEVVHSGNIVCLPHFSLEQIDNAPTVKAIPIEWIEKWADKFFKVIKGKRFYTGDGYDTVWDMLEDWEQEHEESN